MTCFFLLTNICTKKTYTEHSGKLEPNQGPDQNTNTQETRTIWRQIGRARAFNKIRHIRHNLQEEKFFAIFRKSSGVRSEKILLKICNKKKQFKL